MKRLFYLTIEGYPEKLVFFILLGGLFILPVAGKAQEKFFIANEKKIDKPAFDKEVNHILEETGIPAVSLAVIDNNEIVYANAYGYKQLSNRNPVDAATVFEACSLSKSLMAFVAYKLVDEGKLVLDSPMYHYFVPTPLLHDKRYKLITARMVLSHSSGLENWWAFNNKDTLEIISNPGERFIYSGEGYTYLSKVIESLVNKPYEEYIPERVIIPLKLKRSYATFKDNGKLLTNYAIGHNDMLQELEKGKNEGPIPASGVHITAEDYAKLIVSIFDGKNLSRAVIKEILKPVVRIQENNSSLYYGPGFEIFYSNGDTIIAHGGNNPGFKAQMFYSIVSRRGLVFLANGDLGKLISSKLCEMTAGLNIASYFDMDFYDQYPSVTLSLLKSYYKDRNTEALFSEIRKMERSGKLGPKTLSALGDVFSDNDIEISRRLLEEDIRLHPQSSTSYFLLGHLHIKKDEYDLAYRDFMKAKELKFIWDVQGEIEMCKARMN